MDYKTEIIKHYEEIWQNKGLIKTWKKGPMNDFSDSFCVLEFPPSKDRDMWTYATCCMSKPIDPNPIELHLFSSIKSDECIELLTLVSYYHQSAASLNLWHTVNFGKPWQDNSKCTNGLVSLPYLDGPELEDFEANSKLIKFFWLIPITENEVLFKNKNGIEKLEQKFEAANFNYLDVNRKSVV